MRAIELKSSVKALRGPNKSNGQQSQRATPEVKTLEQLGISKTQASRWQQLAQNPKAADRAAKPTGALVVIH
jgi:hypothetical protein